MGKDLTLPVEMNPELGMFCISLRPYRTVELIHAPPVVADCVRKVANEVNGLYARQENFETCSHDKLGVLQALQPNPIVAACVRRLANEVNGLYARQENFEIRSNEKLGVLQFRMSFALFGTENKKKSTLGNLFCIRLLEELHKMGFDLQMSSDLIRDSSSAGCLFFRKLTSERPSAKVVCIAPREDDTIVLLNHSASVKSMVENVIKETWPSGIQMQKDKEVLGEMVHYIKMNGHPWYADEEFNPNINNNEIINRIVRKLSGINLRLVGVINIKGGTDSLFFIEDPRSNAQFSSISLYPSNQKEESLCVKNRLMFRGCPPTTPSSCSSIFLYKRTSVTNTDHILLINFSPGDQELLKTCIMQNYLPGVAGVWQDLPGVEGNNVTFNLVGSPWSSHGGSLHARSLFVHLFAAAINLGFQIVGSSDCLYSNNLDSHIIHLVKMPTQSKIEKNLLPSIEEVIAMARSFLGLLTNHSAQ